MTRFSVVIAAYNQRDRLLEAVESVQKQRFAAHEIIVVDDGSSDGSGNAVRARYSDVTVVLQENRGKGVARNHGALIATGEWVCFLDHDDLWHPQKLAAVDEYLRRRTDVVAVDHGVWIFTEDRDGPDAAWGLRVDFTATTYADAMRCIDEMQIPKNDFAYLQRTGQAYEASLRRVFSTTSALCVRRDVFFKAGGFPPAHANGEDWTLSVNVARLGEWHTLPEALSCQRFLSTSDTGDPAAMVMILSTLVNHWYSGRPMRERTRGFECVGDLHRFAPEYRRMAQAAVWASLRRREIRGASTALWLSMLLLPRWRDRAYAFVPPTITWPLEGLWRRLRNTSRRLALSRSM